MNCCYTEYHYIYDSMKKCKKVKTFIVTAITKIGKSQKFTLSQNSRHPKNLNRSLLIQPQEETTFDVILTFM